MRKIFISFIIVFALLSCKKDEDSIVENESKFFVELYPTNLIKNLEVFVNYPDKITVKFQVDPFPVLPSGNVLIYWNYSLSVMDASEWSFLNEGDLMLNKNVTIEILTDKSIDYYNTKYMISATYRIDKPISTEVSSYSLAEFIIRPKY